MIKHLVELSVVKYKEDVRLQQDEPRLLLGESHPSSSDSLLSLSAAYLSSEIIGKIKIFESQCLQAAAERNNFELIFMFQRGMMTSGEELIMIEIKL